MDHLLIRILKEKCPFCGEGDVFEKKSFPQVPEVNDRCSHCNRDLKGEPGFYFGAMYVSYGIAVLLGILTFLVVTYIFGVSSTFWQVLWVMITVLLLGMKNYKWSRIIWLALLPTRKPKN